jgi:C1A family cysteine protease
MQSYKMGWLPDRPDFRDYSLEKAVETLKDQGLSPSTEVIKLKKATFAKDDNSPILDKALNLLQTPERKTEGRSNTQQPYLLLPLKSPVSNNQYYRSQSTSQEPVDLHLPKSMDLRPWFSPIETQGNLNSCTAHAGVALVEYFQRRALGEYTDASVLFLYKVTRRLMQQTGDSGAAIRPTMRAMALFGMLPEQYLPYDIDAFDVEPPAFCYTYAQNNQATSYFQIDRPQLSKEEILVRIRIAIAAGFPPIFGFAAYSSLFNEKTAKSGKIPYPSEGEKVEGGHALVAVGYDDNKIIKNAKTRGAFRIRNSWGSKWGKHGYGWLPYDYVLEGLAVDWWSLLRSEWVASQSFGFSIRPDGILVGCDPNDPTCSGNPSDLPK